MKDLGYLIEQLTLAEAQKWLAYCEALGIVYFTEFSEDEAANA